MKNLLNILVGVTLLFQPVSGEAQPPDVSLEIQPASFFLPAGAEPLALNGTLEFGPGFLIDDDIVGQPLLAQRLTLLHLTAGTFHFRLHATDEHFNGAVAVPGPFSMQSSFQATLDVFDVQGQMLESGLRMAGSSPYESPNHGLSFSALPLYRNPDSETPELVGVFSFTATAVPEPAPITLLVFATMSGYLILRRSIFRSGQERAVNPKQRVSFPDLLVTPATRTTRPLPDVLDDGRPLKENIFDLASKACVEGKGP